VLVFRSTSRFGGCRSFQSFDYMNRRKVTIWGAAVLSLVLIGGLVVLPLLARARVSNCGGNSAALSACRSVVFSFQVIALDRGGKLISVADLNERERENFCMPPGVSWLHGSSILVTPSPVRIAPGTYKEIIAVCDTAFDNIPQRLIGRPPMSHAVAYSDGSVGLISVKEFRRSDFIRFIDLRDIQYDRRTRRGTE